MSAEAPGSEVIEQEMNTVIFYLTAFGYIDGNFDPRERAYIHEFIDKLVAYRGRLALKDQTVQERDDSIVKWKAYFQSEFEKIDGEIQSYFTESVAEGEETREFVIAKLKLRCYELFKNFAPENQHKLLMLADELASADGEVHPSEKRFRDELERLLAESAGEGSFRDRSQCPAGLVLEAPVKRTPRIEDYEFFRAFEEEYVREPERFAEQIQRDMNLLEKTIESLEARRAAGNGKLGEAKSVADLKGEFLDGYVNVVMPEPGREYELLVIGDLHGCYACFKAALMQADFFHKVDQHHLDPVKNPPIKLVLLGDYIDRGKYSYNGVLRTAMQLFLTVPEHVYLLRGNHEYYIELNGRIFGGVKPAEAIQSLTGLASEQVFRSFKRLFEALPNSMIFDKLLFVHAGIPRQDTLVEKWKDLSSLNDPEIRFQMMWSDPSEAEAIPLTLQKSGARFPFGRQQFKGFMQRLGCTLMVRGHERVNEGLRVAFTDRDATLLTLFSAGGRNNKDLPPESNYREVRPMALTIHHKDGVNRVTPFFLDWERYNKAENNAFFQPPAP